MNNDLVLVKLDNGKNYLFMAPTFSGAHVDDFAEVETACGLKIGRIVAVNTYVNIESDAFYFALTCAGASLPLKKVRAVFSRNDCEWPDENGDNIEVNSIE